jgi:hypothetical protein
MRRPIILINILLISLIANAQSALKPDSLKIYTVKELKDDFVFFRTAMETIHPSLYRYNSKDSVDKWFNSGFAKIDQPMNDIEFLRIPQSILAKLGSGHTNIIPSTASRYTENFTDRYMLPFNVYIRNNGLYVKSCTDPTDTTFKIGDEILVINNQPASALLTQARNQVTGDGYSNNFKDFKLEGSFGSIYKSLHPGQYQFTITYRSGSVVKRKLVKAADLMEKGRRLYFGDIIQLRDKTGPEHKVDYPYDIQSTAVLKIRDFMYEKNYLSFHKQLFKELHDGGIKNLVIDLRNNTGGKDAISIDLMKYLIPKTFHFSLLTESYVTLDRFNQLNKYANASDPLNLSLIDHNLHRDLFNYNMMQYSYSNNNFKGNIYILINNGTFSAAALFATAVKAQVPCTIIGQETGGGIAGCDGGEIVDIMLPNTHSNLTMPLLYTYSVSKQTDYGQGLKPDIEFYPTPMELYNQVYKNIDPFIERLKTVIIAGK